jgi:translocation protein SEC62
MQQHMQRQQQQQQHEHGPNCNHDHDHDHQPRQVPVNPAAPKDPRAIALANFLRSQNLKTRTCILDGNRKELFKGVSYNLIWGILHRLTRDEQSNVPFEP